MNRAVSSALALEEESYRAGINLRVRLQLPV